MLVGAPSTAAAVDDFQSIQGFTVYLWVLPGEILPEHPKGNIASNKSGGVSSQQDQHFVVIAVFDALGLAPIRDAVVTARVSELGFKQVEKRLESLALVGAMIYGNYFAMKSPGPYRIDVHIVRPSTGKSVDVSFMRSLP